MENIRIMIVLFGILESVVTILFLNNCLGIKAKNKKIALLIGIILCWFGFGFFYNNFIVFAIFWIVVMVMYCRIIMNGTVIFQEGIVGGVIIFNMIVRIGSSIFIKSISGVIQKTQQVETTNEVLAFYLQGVTYIAVLCILMTLIHKDYKTTRIERYCSMVYGIGNFLLIWLFLIWGKSKSTDIPGQEYTGWILLNVQMMSLLLLGAVFEIKSNDKLLQENILIKERMKQQQMNILKIEEDYYDARKIRHDIRRSLGIYLRLLETGNVTEVKEQIREQMGSIPENPIVFLDGNSMINAVLNEKRTLCRMKGVELRIQWTVKIESKMEMDMAILLSNLLDNAIEAQEEGEPYRAIFVHICEQHGMYNVVVKNPVRISVLETNPCFETKKENYLQHGIGLKSVRDTVEKYDGIIDFEEMNGTFIAHVAMPK